MGGGTIDLSLIFFDKKSWRTKIVQVDNFQSPGHDWEKCYYWSKIMQLLSNTGLFVGINIIGDSWISNLNLLFYKLELV